jgi:hypothetical protein
MRTVSIKTGDNVKTTDTGTYRLLMEDEKQQRLEFAGRILKEKPWFCHVEGVKWEFKKGNRRGIGNGSLRYDE